MTKTPPLDRPIQALHFFSVQMQKSPNVFYFSLPTCDILQWKQEKNEKKQGKEEKQKREPMKLVLNGKFLPIFAQV